MTNNLAYLGQPYAHTSTIVQSVRGTLACVVSGELNRRGIPNFSPIAHSYRIHHAPPNGWVKALDLPILRICNSLKVLMIAGWRESVGLAEEIKFATEHGIEIEYLEPKDIVPFEHETILTWHEKYVNPSVMG
jgi:hypothetical protein